MVYRIVLFLLIGSLSAGSLQAQTQDPELANAIIADVVGNSKTIKHISQKLWDFAELGFQEVKSSQLLQTELEQAGFEIESGVASMPTAFVASYGKGKPIIAVLAEFDALPGLSQAAVPMRSPIPGKQNGHGCGHNLFGAGSVGGAIALKNWLKSTATAGTIRLYGAPAEEGGGAKAYMVRDGLFKDVDVALHWHPSGGNGAGVTTNLAKMSAKVRFQGRSAHAASSPERGRSALDGVEAFTYMLNLMREHVDSGTRIHYVITQGGDAPNTVPDFAEVFLYVRNPDRAEVRNIWKRVSAAAEGAALGTATKVELAEVSGTYNMLPNKTLAEAVHGKLVKVGGVTYTSEELEFAKKMISSFETEPRRKLGSQEMVRAFNPEVRFYPASSDVGDVSWSVPTAGFAVATWVPGTAAHSWQSTAGSGYSIGSKAAVNAAKVIALTGVELFTNPELVEQAKKEFRNRQGPDFVYEPLMGGIPPPLDYRK